MSAQNSNIPSDIEVAYSALLNRVDTSLERFEKRLDEMQEKDGKTAQAMVELTAELRGLRKELHGVPAKVERLSYTVYGDGGDTGLNDRCTKNAMRIERIEKFNWKLVGAFIIIQILSALLIGGIVQINL